MQAMTFMLPPQTGHVSMSISNTRFKRCAQLIAAWLATGGQAEQLMPKTAGSAALQAIDPAVFKSGSVPSEQFGSDKQQQQSCPAKHHNLWQNLQ